MLVHAFWLTILSLYTVIKLTRRRSYQPLPYYGHLNCIIHINLEKKKLLKSHCPNSKFKFVFCNPFTSKNIFLFIDRISPLLSFDIVYQFEWPTCTSRYIGETGRILIFSLAGIGRFTLFTVLDSRTLA